MPISTNSNTMTLSAYVTGANNVVFDWGDGLYTSKMVSTDVSSLYNASHTYASKGTYLITIYATNDMGTTTSKVMYQAGYADDQTPADNEDNNTDSDKKSFFDEHGYQFLIFAILTVLLMVAFFYFGFQNPMVIILAIVMAALAVLCFVYNDISGVIDAVKGLFDKA